jgi:hypothetical protein
MALAWRQTHLFRSGLRTIQKVEWADHYIQARSVAINKKNILSAWRGAGIFPENVFKVLHQLSEPNLITSTPNGSPVAVISTPFFAHSSPPEPSVL